MTSTPDPMQPGPQGQAPPQPGGYPPPGYQAPPGQGYPPPPGGYPPPGYQAPPGQAPYASAEQDAAENKAMGVLAYIIWLIPLLAAPKQSRFARFHTNQGLVLFLLGVAYGIVSSILVGIISAAAVTSGSVITGLGALGLVSTILGLAWFVYPVLAIIGIINAAQGRMKPLPLIGSITILK
ncbi:MAG: hypothetical protein LBK59_11610 [Bifidobacteriaceae bacterium]|jgi:uncharacterized membrane protein|nr:hypothetical protein [Bifidobacteriaceae bacterium]